MRIRIGQVRKFWKVGCLDAYDVFSLSNFGVNLTRLAPGALSALRHAHSAQDEFVYVLQGNPVLVTDVGETQLHPGMCAGFKAGTGDGHQLVGTSNNKNSAV